MRIYSIYVLFLNIIIVFFNVRKHLVASESVKLFGMEGEILVRSLQVEKLEEREKRKEKR
jgi:hypothetical protein